MRGFFWYVFPRMENVVINISDIAAEGDYLLIHQNFPPLDSDFIGKEVIPTPDALAAFFAPRFEFLITNRLENKQRKANDNWFTAVMRKR